MNKNDRVEVAVVIEKLDNLIATTEKEHKDMNEHLKELNNQVAKNTKWINLATGALKVLGIVFGSGGVIAVIGFIVSAIR